jgi:hypothetical protein
MEGEYKNGKKASEWAEWDAEGKPLTPAAASQPAGP